MLLAIDIGNTNIHIGLAPPEGDGWAASWRARTLSHKMPDEYLVLLRGFFEEDGFTFEDVSGVGARDDWMVQGARMRPSFVSDGHLIFSFNLDI